MEGAGSILESWEPSRPSCKTRSAKKNCQQLEGFNSAWQRRDFADMWKTARRLSGKNLGPKKRVDNKPVTARPSIADWSAHLAIPSKEGHRLQNRCVKLSVSKNMILGLQIGKWRALPMRISMAWLFMSIKQSYARLPHHGLPQQKFGDNFSSLNTIKPLWPSGVHTVHPALAANTPTMAARYVCPIGQAWQTGLSGHTLH